MFISMNKLIWIVCVVFVVAVDATIFHQQCQISCLDSSEDEFSDFSFRCSVLEEKLASCEEKLSKKEDELVKTEKELSELKERPRDCYDVIYYNPDATCGIYTIFPPNYRPQGIQVWCDMETDGGGWIVLQSRKDGSVDFYRGWRDYVNGFGNLTQEFWLGLQYMHELTKYGTYDLRIDLTDFEKHEAYAVYSSFSIGEGPGYMLKFGDYFGDAGDSLRYHLNRNFTTFDHDEDDLEDDSPFGLEWDGNCAKKHQGAWWYRYCQRSNLNAKYLGGTYENDYPIGMTWREWKGDFYSLKTSNMKIRPRFANYV